jgi:ATP-dependent Clp protease ATP-binding subunit ClpC
VSDDRFELGVWFGELAEVGLRAAEARNAGSDESTGRAVTLHGAGALPELRSVAAALLSVAPAPAGEVRRYFLGRAPHVEDPGTGASIPRIKDVLRGELEIFIAAWVGRNSGSATRPAGGTGA